MRHIPVERAFLTAGPGLLALALVMVTLACGPAAAPTPGGGAPGIPAATVMPAATALPAATAIPAGGGQVGDRVQAFTIKLADGTQVTSQELLVQHRPTFLFFFATW